MLTTLTSLGFADDGAFSFLVIMGEGPKKLALLEKPDIGVGIESSSWNS